MAEDTFTTPVTQPQEEFVGWFPARIEVDRDELLDLLAGNRTTVKATAIGFIHKGATRQVDAETGAVQYQIAGGLNVGRVAANLNETQARALMALFRPAVRQAAIDKLGL